MPKIDHAGYTAQQITTATTTALSNNKTLFSGYTINDAICKGISAIDGTVATDPIFLYLDAPGKGLWTLDMPIALNKGLTIVTASASKVTVIYKRDPDY